MIRPRGPGEEHRQRTIRQKLARMDECPVTALSTGFRALDDALGPAGLPRGRIVEIFGPPDAGKTTLALQIVARLQHHGLTVAWVDAENTFDPAWAASLGVSLEGLPVLRPETAETALEILHRLARTVALDLVVVDSAAALVPSLELEAGLGDGSPGLQARVLASGLRTLARLAANAAMAVVFLNQARIRKDREGGESETSACGPALKLHAAVRIALRPAGSGRVAFRILKNKVATPFAAGELVRPAGGRFTESP